MVSSLVSLHPSSAMAMELRPFGMNDLTGFESWPLLINDALAVGDSEDIGFFLGAKDSWAGNWLHMQNPVGLPVDRKS
ncbi:MAG: hypothetical protein K0S45_4614 [Nitrospira sp.]|nr:hypothetical protein [Nitrospira sp.]